jgi:hypothetical protein
MGLAYIEATQLYLGVRGIAALIHAQLLPTLLQILNASGTKSSAPNYLVVYQVSYEAHQTVKL